MFFNINDTDGLNMHLHVHFTKDSTRNLLSNTLVINPLHPMFLQLQQK
jgi:hypothetical protein